MCHLPPAPAGPSRRGWSFQVENQVEKLPGLAGFSNLRTAGVSMILDQQAWEVSMSRVFQNLTKITIAAALLVGLVGLTGCANNAQTGALIGGGAGAGLGAIIGNQSRGRSGEGALIGAGVGAIGGYIIGNEMDKDQQRYQDHHRYAAPPPHYSAPPRYERYDDYGAGARYEHSTYRRYESPGYERRTYERYEYGR
jgi:hypothetical protein